MLICSDLWSVICCCTLSNKVRFGGGLVCRNITSFYRAQSWRNVMYVMITYLRNVRATKINVRYFNMCSLVIEKKYITRDVAAEHAL